MRWEAIRLGATPGKACLRSSLRGIAEQTATTSTCRAGPDQASATAHMAGDPLIRTMALPFQPQPPCAPPKYTSQTFLQHRECLTEPGPGELNGNVNGVPGASLNKERHHAFSLGQQFGGAQVTVCCGVPSTGHISTCGSLGPGCDTPSYA